MKISTLVKGELPKWEDNIDLKSLKQPHNPRANKELRVKETSDTNIEDVPIDRNKLEEAVKSANDVMEAIDRGFRFSIHEGTNRTMVKIIDRRDKEVIKELPPEKMLDLVAKIWETVGLVIDEKI